MTSSVYMHKNIFHLEKLVPQKCKWQVIKNHQVYQMTLYSRLLLPHYKMRMLWHLISKVPSSFGIMQNMDNQECKDRDGVVVWIRSAFTIGSSIWALGPLLFVLFGEIMGKCSLEEEVYHLSLGVGFELLKVSHYSWFALSASLLRLKMWPLSFLLLQPCLPPGVMPSQTIMDSYFLETASQNKYLLP